MKDVWSGGKGSLRRRLPLLSYELTARTIEVEHVVLILPTRCLSHFRFLVELGNIILVHRGFTMAIWWFLDIEN